MSEVVEEWWVPKDCDVTVRDVRRGDDWYLNIVGTKSELFRMANSILDHIGDQ